MRVGAVPAPPGDDDLDLVDGGVDEARVARDVPGRHQRLDVRADDAAHVVGREDALGDDVRRTRRADLLARLQDDDEPRRQASGPPPRGSGRRGPAR